MATAGALPLLLMGAARSAPLPDEAAAAIGAKVGGLSAKATREADPIIIRAASPVVAQAAAKTAVLASPPPNRSISRGHVPPRDWHAALRVELPPVAPVPPPAAKAVPVAAGGAEIAQLSVEAIMASRARAVPAAETTKPNRQQESAEKSEARAPEQAALKGLASRRLAPLDFSPIGASLGPRPDGGEGDELARQDAQPAPPAAELAAPVHSAALRQRPGAVTTAEPATGLDPRVAMPQIATVRDSAYVAQLTSAHHEARMAVRMGERTLGHVAFQIDGARAINVHVGQILDLFQGRFDDARFAYLRGSSASEEFVALERLRDGGVPIVYDPVYDELVIDDAGRG